MRCTEKGKMTYQDHQVAIMWSSRSKDLNDCYESKIPLLWKTTGNPKVLLPPPLRITLCTSLTRMPELMTKHLWVILAQVSPIAKCTYCIRRPLKVRFWCPQRGKEEAGTIPGVKEIPQPGKVQLKVAVRTNWMVILSEGCQKIDDPSQKCGAQHSADEQQMISVVSAWSVFSW